jgi:hypothetical protein
MSAKTALILAIWGDPGIIFFTKIKMWLEFVSSDNVYIVLQYTFGYLSNYVPIIKQF